MQEMRCAGCTGSGTVMFMDAVLCGECFFRQTVLARAIRGSLEPSGGRLPVPEAGRGTQRADVVGRVVTRLQRDLADLVSVLGSAESAEANRAAAGSASGRQRRQRGTEDAPQAAS